MSRSHAHGGHVHHHVDAGLHSHDPETGDAVPAVPPPRRIAAGVLEIDTMLGGWERVTAGYLIEGSAPVLIETGSQSSVPVLLAALGQIGVGPAELAGVAVTHIHLDHAGGVGDVARAFPSATVYVHEKGARHLADPTRLVDSAARVYGPLLDSLYGRIDPTPPERLHVLGDGEEIAVEPGRTLVAVDSPGHAKHHVGLHDSLSGVLFAGDAVGVKLPDGGCPAALDPAAGLRPRPGADLARQVRGAPAVGHRAGPLRAAGASPRRSSPRPRRPCASGPRRRRRRTARAPTSRMPSRPASTRCSATSTPPTRRSSTS